MALSKKAKAIVGIVICIGGLAAALAWFTHARSASPRAHCITTLKALDGLKSIWAIEQKKRNEDVPGWNDLVGPGRNITEIPRCPQGGSYILGRVDERPRCTFPGHTISHVPEGTVLPAASEVGPLDEVKAIALAREAVAANDSWADKATFEAKRDGAGWSVIAWRQPQVPGGYRVIQIDDKGKVTSYFYGR